MGGSIGGIKAIVKGTKRIETEEMASSTAQAYMIFASGDAHTQSRAGFDGWVMLLRDDYDTEDQAWSQERLRLRACVEQKLQGLEAAGICLELLELEVAVNLLVSAPDYDPDEERLWCIEFFPMKMYDYVVRGSLPMAKPRLQRREACPEGCPSIATHPSHRAMASAVERSRAAVAADAAPINATGGGRGAEARVGWRRWAGQRPARRRRRRQQMVGEENHHHPSAFAWCRFKVTHSC